MPGKWARHQRISGSADRYVRLGCHGCAGRSAELVRADGARAGCGASMGCSASGGECWWAARRRYCHKHRSALPAGVRAAQFEQPRPPLPYRPPI